MQSFELQKWVLPFWRPPTTLNLVPNDKGCDIMFKKYYGHMIEYFRWAQGNYDFLSLFEDSHMTRCLTNIFLNWITANRFWAWVSNHTSIYRLKITKFYYLQISLCHPVLTSFLMVKSNLFQKHQSLGHSSTQCAEENSTERLKDKKLLYTGLAGMLQGFQKYFFQNPRKWGVESAS